jgi:hypothetical protein
MTENERLCDALVALRDLGFTNRHARRVHHFHGRPGAGRSIPWLIGYFTKHKTLGNDNANRKFLHRLEMIRDAIRTRRLRTPGQSNSVPPEILDDLCEEAVGEIPLDNTQRLVRPLR